MFRTPTLFEKTFLSLSRKKDFPDNDVFESRMPDKETLEYLESSYPTNHNYSLKNGKLIPTRKLARRYTDITSHYPKQMQSILDLSCSKGYFNFDAVRSFGCKRSMGIDVMDAELRACAAVQKYLGDEVTYFKKMRLHELAEKIDNFGGPFDVTLVVNCYQYLYFGSKLFSGSYMSHDDIFRDMRKVCNGKVIFSNRLELKYLQDYPAKIAKGGDMIEAYDEQSVFAAASTYFHVNKVGKLGRYPFWTLDAR